MTKKSLSLQDTGERMIPEHHQGNIIYGEHIVRYEAAKTMVKNKTVLDIASGSGYGSFLMSENAKKIIGVDVDQESVEYARENFKKPNLNFVTGDGIKIPVGDNEVDIVVSFETIEHIKDYRKFLQEVKRVLKPDGLLLISTPNDKEFAKGNHFHFHEFKRKELKDLLQKYFSNTEWYYQNSWLYSALLPVKEMKDGGAFIADTINASPVDEEHCLYFFAICSNRPIKHNIKPIGTISQVWSAKAVQEEAKIRLLTEQHVRNLESTTRSQKKDIQNLQQELYRVKSSYAWKLTHKTSKIISKIRGDR